MAGHHRASRHVRGAHRAQSRQRRLGHVSVAALAATVVGASLAFGAADDQEATSAEPSPPTLTPRASDLSRGREPTDSRLVEPVRALRSTLGVSPQTRAHQRRERKAGPGTLPEEGSGTFVVATGSTPTFGTGDLVTYSVEIEREVPLNPALVAQTVDAVLADRRGWTVTGEHALARRETESDIRILLATPETADKLCLPLDTGGRLSCRNGDLVVLNAWRWLNGASTYDDNLVNYRRYLVNHEVGHALGNAHADCPGLDQLAPVMMQQTKGVGTCVANPWPVP